MIYDLETALGTIDRSPRDFAIQMGTTNSAGNYATRPLVAGDIDQIGRIDTMTDEQVRSFVTNLFEEPRPNLSDVDGVKLGAIVTAIVAYQKGRVAKKKSQEKAAVASVAAAIEAAMT